MVKLDIANFLVTLKDGRTLRVFTTNTYYFTEYTFDKAMAIDPEIDVILCSSPYASYSAQAKNLCIENQIGLFMLGEFMGAISKQGNEFLNYLLQDEKSARLTNFGNSLKKLKFPVGIDVYLFGSYLRSQLYRDIDVILVYKDELSKQEIEIAKQAIGVAIRKEADKLDFTVCSSAEFFALKLNHDNRIKVTTFA